MTYIYVEIIWRKLANATPQQFIFSQLYNQDGGDITERQKSPTNYLRSRWRQEKEEAVKD